MQVRWLWAVLDLPAEGFDEQLEFWRQVTRTRVAPWRGGHGEFATLLPADGDPWVKVQRVGRSGGVHVDLEVDVPLDRARDQAVALGAQVVTELDDVVVLRSPGGFAFCLVRWAPDATSRGQARGGQPSLLDQVCLDIPAHGHAAELAFWTRLTGWSVPTPEPGVSGLLPLTRPSGMPVRLLTQRLDEPNARVTAHVDLACEDRAAQTSLHESFGARVESTHDGWGWTVLRTPGGTRYCLTDRDPATGLRP